MSSATVEASPQLQPSRLGGCLGWLVFILAALWVISITLGRLAAQWFATGFLTSIPDSLWASFPALQSIFLLLPLALLAVISRSAIRKALYRTWFSAAAFVLLLAPVSLLFPAAMHGNPGADRNQLATPWLAGGLPALSRENRESGDR
jgi:hypothetical protein